MDANHKTVAGYFEKLGCLVHHTIGDWDLTVAKFGAVRLIEVKDPKSPNLKRRNKGNELIEKGFPIVRVLDLDGVIDVVDDLNASCLTRNK